MENGAERGVGAIRALREHIGLGVEALADRAGFDATLLKACEEHEGIAAPAPCFKGRPWRALLVFPWKLYFTEAEGR
jgi:hypothetical protein